jgi:putative DNA primase/helicase
MPSPDTADLLETWGEDVSDAALARVFTETYRHRARYCAALDSWLLWDGQRWLFDETNEAVDLSRQLFAGLLETRLSDPDIGETQSRRLRDRLGSSRTISAALHLAGADRAHSISVSELDANPLLLNTPGGLVYLATGETLLHEPRALCTKLTAASPEGDCPLFLQALSRAVPDEQVREFLQRFFGYSLTGFAREHILPFVYGAGRNGKSLIVNAVRRAMGDYGMTAAPELLMESRHDRHPTEIASLRGRRLVVCSEVDTGRNWNEARLKRLTGGDGLSARFMGRDLFEFEPSHKIVVIGNSKPGIKNVDEAIRSRLHLIPFGVTIPAEERDTTLPERLEAEYGGILAWAIRGCLAYQKVGLAPPRAVLEESRDYLDREDTVGLWISGCCAAGGTLRLKDAKASYDAWCRETQSYALGRNHFSDRLVALGYQRLTERKQPPYFEGIHLVATGE